MTEQTVVLLACLGVIAVLAILIYVQSRSQASALAAICELRRSLDHIEQTLQTHGHVLYDAHKRIYTVSKGVEKPAS